MIKIARNLNTCQTIDRQSHARVGSSLLASIGEGGVRGGTIMLASTREGVVRGGASHVLPKGEYDMVRMLSSLPTNSLISMNTGSNLPLMSAERRSSW